MVIPKTPPSQHEKTPVPKHALGSMIEPQIVALTQVVPQGVQHKPQVRAALIPMALTTGNH